MSMKNLTREQLAEDRYWGSDADREDIAYELNRRAEMREERACRAEDERDE